MHKILLVDDEENVLNALRRELRGLYEIEVFSSAGEALKRCRETQFDLVISDYQMPEMNGVQFLIQVGQIQPDTARLVLSGQANIDALVSAINETHIYRFLAKPWDREELQANITQALAFRGIVLENRRQADDYRSPREERYQIYALKNAEHKQSEIAELLQRSKSTIGRELARNRGGRGYRPKQAHSMAEDRRAMNARTIDDATWQFAQEKLMLQWSPDQISQHAAISIETVYQRVYANKRAGGLLWKNLRCQKQRRKRYGKTDRRGAIPNRLSIEDRPAIVETRSRIGDWEADTVIGKGHRQAIVSVVERKTGFTLIRKVERKTAQAVTEAMTTLLKPYRNKVHTITSDNGREFAGHEEIANQLKADFYFAHPYSSWERGTNENTNGLIRQYFPKNRDFTTITQQEIDMAMERLNNRPRKRLGYQTPNQVFFKSGVALQI